MKSLEFEAKISEDGRIIVPAELARELPSGKPLQIVLLWDDAQPDQEWRDSAAERFAAAYAPDDSVYEELMDETR